MYKAHLLALGQLATTRIVLPFISAITHSSRLTEEIHDTVHNQKLVASIVNEACYISFSTLRVHGLSSPLSKFHQKITLLLRTPSASSEDILKNHFRLDAEPIGDVSDTVGTECTSDGVSYVQR